MLTAMLSCIVQLLCAQQALPVDPQLRYGKLSNGFTYYIRKNNQPENQIHMRLIVNAGSYSEDADQAENAHLVEHLAFEGTKNFPGDSIRRYTTGKGLIFGNEITANTGSSNTGYKLDIPSGDPEFFKQSLKILREYAQELTLMPESIVAQAGAVTEEWRRNLGPSNTAHGEKYSTLFNNPYLHNSSKEETERMNTFKQKISEKPETVIRFYKDWYRPDLEAVIIVGNIDPDAVEAQVKALFSDLKMPAQPRNARPDNFGAQSLAKLTGRNRVLRFNNPVSQDILVEVIQKRKTRHISIKTEEDLRNSILRELCGKLYAGRFGNIPPQYNAPTIIAVPSENLYESGLGLLNSQAKLRNAAEVKYVVETIAAEQERIRKYGFTEKEFAAARKSYQEDYQAVNRFNSKSLTSDYREHFTTQQVPLAPEYDAQLTAQLLSSISLQEMNNCIKEWLNSFQERDIILTLPETPAGKLAADGDINKWFDAAKQKKYEPFRLQELAPGALMTVAQINALQSAGIKTYPWAQDASVTVAELANGVKVLVKANRKFNKRGQGRIVLRAHSYGGARLYQGNDYFAALAGPGIVLNSGVAGFNKFQLDAYKLPMAIHASTFVAHDQETIGGECNAGALEPMLQLVYLQLTAPRKDAIAFNDWTSEMIPELKRRQKGMYGILMAFSGAVAGNNQELTPQALQDINLDNAYRIYRERFGNAADFVFLLYGDFEQQEALSLLQKYVGNLPASKKFDYGTQQNVLPVDSIRETIYTKDTDVPLVSMVYPGTKLYAYTDKNNVCLEVLGKVLHSVIMERLRTREGCTYDPTGMANSWRVNKYQGNYQFRVQYTCAPENINKLVAATKEEFDALRNNGPTEEQFNTALSAVKGDLQFKLGEEKHFEIAEILERYRYSRQEPEAASWMKALNALKREDVAAAAKEFMTDEYLQHLTVMPERKIVAAK